MVAEIVLVIVEIALGSGRIAVAAGTVVAVCAWLPQDTACLPGRLELAFRQRLAALFGLESLGSAAGECLVVAPASAAVAASACLGLQQTARHVLVFVGFEQHCYTLAHRLEFAG